MTHSHSVHLPLGALLIWWAMCGSGLSTRSLTLPLPHLPHRFGVQLALEAGVAPLIAAHNPTDFLDVESLACATTTILLIYYYYVVLYYYPPTS